MLTWFVLSGLELENKSDKLFITLGLMLCTSVMFSYSILGSFDSVYINTTRLSS